MLIRVMWCVFLRFRIVLWGVLPSYDQSSIQTASSLVCRYRWTDLNLSTDAGTCQLIDPLRIKWNGCNARECELIAEPNKLRLFSTVAIDMWDTIFYYDAFCLKTCSLQTSHTYAHGWIWRQQINWNICYRTITGSITLSSHSNVKITPPGGRGARWRCCHQ